MQNKEHLLNTLNFFYCISTCFVSIIIASTLAHAAVTGDGNPWIRHPTDIVLPGGATEYAGYDLTPSGNYSALAPVAWTDPADQSDRDTAVVMCLSCHRPHGTVYDDILRWDYNDCNTGTANPGCGCFVCHTTKDD